MVIKENGLLALVDWDGSYFNIDLLMTFLHTKVASRLVDLFMDWIPSSTNFGQTLRSDVLTCGPLGAVQSLAHSVNLCCQFFGFFCFSPNFFQKSIFMFLSLSIVMENILSVIQRDKNIKLDFWNKVKRKYSVSSI